MERNWKAGAVYLSLVGFVTWAIWPLPERLDERLNQHDDFNTACALKDGEVGELESERICIKGKRVVLREVMP